MNIGDRQKGRLRAESVLDCAGTKEDISAAIRAAHQFFGREVVNPYGDGHSAQRIVEALRSVSSQRSRDDILAKRFIQLG